MRFSGGGRRPYWRSQMPLWMLVAGVLLIVALIAAVIVLTLTGGTETGTTVRDINEDPEGFQGRQVTISGSVAEVLGQNAFVIGGAGYLGGGLLVVSAEELPSVVVNEQEVYRFEAEEIVQVTGRVRYFDRAEIEAGTGVQLAEEDFSAYSGDPVLVADNVIVTPRVRPAEE